MPCWRKHQASLRRRLAEGGTSGELFDREQRATHGLAWFATYAEAARQLAAYAERMATQGRSVKDPFRYRIRASRLPDQLQLRSAVDVDLPSDR
jgi:hypothetical protein